MLIDVISKTSTIDDWPKEFASESHSSPIIRICDLKQAITSNDFQKITDHIVIPQAQEVFGRYVSKGFDIPRAIVFGDDQWSNKYCRATSHVAVRKADFTKIKSPSLRLEAKVIGTSWLWFVTNKSSSKLGSILRKIENLILAYIELERLNCKSFFNTNNPNVASSLIANISCKRSKRSTWNILVSLNSVSLLNTLELGGQYLSKTNFLARSKKYEWDDSNQHYCIPFRIFMEYWQYYITQLDTEFSLLSYKELRLLMDLIYRFHHQARENNWSSKKRADKFNLYCRDEIQHKLKKLAKSKWPVMRDVVCLNTNKRYASKEPYYYIYLQRLENWLFSIGELASHCIQTMTGMRDSERRELKLGGLIKNVDEVGVVTTFHKFAPESGISDIFAAPQYVASLYENMLQLYSTVFNSKLNSLQKVPIMGIHWMDFIRESKFIPIAGAHHQRRREHRRSDANIVINEHDLHEFKLLNPNIRSHKKVDKEIYVGALWPFKTHDSRRSIAVHLSRLDLVTTNDLARQFKHFAHTQTEWYTSGFEHGGQKYQIAEDFSREIDDATAELSASLAMKLQNSPVLTGEGGKQLMENRSNVNAPKIYPSFKKAKSMAMRNSQHLRSLGNGFYCMNGQNCEFKPIISSASCNTMCPSMIADKDSIPIWKMRRDRYKSLLEDAKKEGASEISIEFLRLELEFYQDAINSLGDTENDKSETNCKKS